jgi:hypothetical protein
MRFEVLALRPFHPTPVTGFVADVTLGYADLTITGCHLGFDEAGQAFVSFPKLQGIRARLHCKESGTRRKMVDDVAALYRAMQAAAETPLAKALPMDANHDTSRNARAPRGNGRRDAHHQR